MLSMMGSGIAIDKQLSRLDNRYYPFGAATVHLISDLRNGDNFARL